MFPGELVGLIQQRPFVPFRLHISGGTVYDVRHPDLVMVTVAIVVIGDPDPDHPGMALTAGIVNTGHVIRIELIATPPAASN